MAFNPLRIDSQVFYNNNSVMNNVYPNRATMNANNCVPIVYQNSIFHSNRMPTVNVINKLLSNECNCDKDFVKFCKMHSISHSECNYTKQVKCELCSISTDHKSIHCHLSGERHRQRHKQLMEFVFLNSIPPQSLSQTTKISQLLEDLYRKNSLNEIDINKRLTVVQDINKLLKTNGLNDYSIRLYGSSINGFGLKNSDINCDLVLNQLENNDKTQEKTTKNEKTLNSVAVVLARVSDIIEKSKHFSQVRNEYNLKVPKVRFREKRFNFEVELSITVEKSYRSSRLLQQYSMIDDRVRILGVALREWAHIYGFDDQENGLWPAFTFPVMVIHYLQRCSPPVLPCLHEMFPNTPTVNKTENNSMKAIIEENEGLEDVFDLKLMQWTHTNTKSVGELWLEMLRYYVLDFDPFTYIISIRNTNLLLRRDKNWSTRMLAVEDPTRPSLNLSRSVGTLRLYNVFVDQLRHTFKYFAIPFINVLPNNTSSNIRVSPLFGERDFEILVDQHVYYPNAQNKDLLAQMNGLSMDTNSETKNNRDSDDSDSDEENRKNENFNSKAKKILSTFGILMKLSPEIERTIPLIPTNQYVYSFQLRQMPFFQRPPKFCRLCHRYSHQQERCPDNELPILRNLPDFMDEEFNQLLDRICFDIFRNLRMDENDERLQASILEDLQSFIRVQVPNATLELFGSTKNGFGARNCDLDICLTFDDNQTGEGLEFAHIIENVGQILTKHQKVFNIIPIVSAKVPIVKFAYVTENDRQIECDISLYNILARYNTLLLRRYTQIDPRVQVLGFVVKHFAKTCDMCDASRGSLSSYAYSLMTIHYLQQKGIIPVLQEIGLDHKFERIVDGWDTWFYDDLTNLDKYWTRTPNQESVAQLFLGFLRYYSEVFNFDDNVVCCRQFAPLKRLEKMWTGSRIAIEDPFLLSHNLGAGVGPQMAVFIRTSIVLGRNLIGCPPQRLEPGYRSWSEYFFNRRLLTHGLPPTGRGCRVCGKIGHKQNNCPERQQEKRERHDRPERSNRFERNERNDRMLTDAQHSRQPQDYRQHRENRQPREDQHNRDDRQTREYRQNREDHQIRDDRQIHNNDHQIRDDRQIRDDHQTRDDGQIRDDRQIRDGRQTRDNRQTRDYRQLRDDRSNLTTHRPSHQMDSRANRGERTNRRTNKRYTQTRNN